MAAKPEKIPEPVLEGIRRYVSQHNLTTNQHVELLGPKSLKWDSLNGCYYFMRHGMYLGVELDGHVHS